MCLRLQGTQGVCLRKVALGLKTAHNVLEALKTPYKGDLLNRLNRKTGPQGNPQKKILLIPCLVAIELTRS